MQLALLDHQRSELSVNHLSLLVGSYTVVLAWDQIAEKCFMLKARQIGLRPKGQMSTLVDPPRIKSASSLREHAGMVYTARKETKGVSSSEKRKKSDREGTERRWHPRLTPSQQNYKR